MQALAVVSVTEILLEVVLARHAFKQVQPQVWRRGRRHGKRYAAYLSEGKLTVAWSHMSKGGSVTLDVKSMSAPELDSQLSSLVRM